jgi:hypothetical protein
VKIVSKKQNEEFIMRNRIEQIRKRDEAAKTQRFNNLRRLHNDEDEDDGDGGGGAGISWGMGFDEEEAVA